MNVHVDMNRCDRHGQCAIAAPAVFELTDDNELIYLPEVDESMRDAVVAASDVCPTAAIRIDE
jgi:ferredoxin